MRPLEQFAKQRGITFECQPVNSRKCRIGQYKLAFTLYFSQGSGHTKAPTLCDVLSCMAADDAASYENAGSFEDWAQEYGWDTDSRKAEKVYRAVKRQAEQLKRVLGADNYAYLIFDVMNAEREAESA